MKDRKLRVHLSRGEHDNVTQNTGEAIRVSRRIHVGNVTAKISSKDLSEYFSKFGPISNFFIPRESPVSALHGFFSVL